MISFVLSVAAALAGWQADPSTAAISPPHVSATKGAFVHASPYPQEAVRLRQEGLAVLLVHVSVKGKVTACSIAESSGYASLDEASCKTVRQVRFDPARNADGRAVEGDTRFPMHWRLPAR